MKFDHLELLLQKVLKQRNFSYFISLGLLVSNIVLGFKVFYHDERWILIPQFDTDRRLEVRTSGFSERYLMEWADGVTRHLLTVNSDTITRHSHDILRITSSAHGRFKKKFEADARKIKENAISTVFYPQQFVVNQNSKTIQVTGKFLTFFGTDKLPVIVKKAYRLEWEVNGRGCIFLKDFNEENNETNS